MYTNNVQRVNNRESIDSPFVSFKKLKYSYSVSFHTQLRMQIHPPIQYDDSVSSQFFQYTFSVPFFQAKE